MVGPLSANLREYWDEHLAGATGVDFPADWRRDPLGRRLAEEQVILPAGLLAPAGAGDAAAIHLPDRFATVLAAWYAILHRHTGQADLLIGTRFLAAGDGSPAVPGKNYVVLPLRTVINPAGSFAELVEQARDTVTGAFGHALASMDSGPFAGPQLPVGATLARMIPGSGPDAAPGSPPGAEFGLELIVSEAGAETTVRLAYDAGQFSRPTAVRLLRHLERFLAQARLAPRTPVRRLRIADEPGPPPAWPLGGPRGPRGPRGPDPDESLVDAFRAIAARYPDRIAVSGSAGEYRYSRLDRDSAVLAVRLRQLAGAGRRIALLCGHDAGLALGIWSTLKAGAAYVPLDPRQPDDRLARILADARVDAIACDDGLARRAAALARGKPVVPLAGAGPDDDAGPLPPVAPGSLAYLLHTSGTTGGPKAVMQTHAGVLGHARAYAHRIGSGPEDRVPLLARFNFDLAVVDFFATLLTGGSLHVIDPLLPAPDLWRRIGAARATIVHGTPTLYRHLLSGLAGARDGDPGRPAVPATIRAVVLGGERVTRDDLHAFLAHFPEQCALVSGLSATECSVALQHLSTRSDLAAAALPVGHPVDGVHVRLLDDDGLPTEVFGELEILSERVALGYWNRPEATAAAFGEYPGGTRYYRTGDLARRLPDGALVHCGRKDRQVKIRGHRIEPSEIEATLRLHPTVAQAAVRFDERPGRPRLVAYATSATAVPLDADELAGYLGRQLPDYAVPERVLALDEMPIGPTGKLDYARLPLPGDEVTAGGDPPSGPLEAAVAGIWRQVLGLTRVSTRATFMASGGDSVRLMTMMARLSEDLHADLSLADILRNPTVAGIAGLIERGGAGS